MATVLRVVNLSRRKFLNIFKQNGLKKVGMEQQIRSQVTSPTGAVLAKPDKVPFGLPRIILTVLPGLYLGATLSKEGAAFLEENDIFVPSEDDDDD